MRHKFDNKIKTNYFCIKMGFNKRFVDSEKVKKCLNENGKLKDLFRADAIIFLDEISSEVFEWYSKGMSDGEIKNKLKNL